MIEKNASGKQPADLTKKAEEDWKSHHDTTDRYPDNAKGIGETEVKNAHASGDGSLEKYDTRVPDQNDTGSTNSDLQNGQERGPVDPPY